MQLKTIRNRVEYFKSFVYGRAKWVEDGEGPRIEVAIEARKNGRPICSGCGQPASGYERLPERRFEFVPLWGIAVFFVYAMRRVECPACGVKAGASAPGRHRGHRRRRDPMAAGPQVPDAGVPDR